MFLLKTFRSCIAAIEDRYNQDIREYLSEVCQNARREDLENWRQFYIKFLHPIDIEAQNIIKNKTYLVDDPEILGSFLTKVFFISISDIFTKFLHVSASHQYQMEFWYNSKGKLVTYFANYIESL